MKDVLVRYRSVLICVVLVGVTAGVYRRVVGYDFVNFDDPMYVSENKRVNEGFSWEGIKWAFTPGKVAYWHPVTWLSHMLDCEVFGLRAGFHHLSNLIIHMVNSLLLFFVFKRMTGAVWRSAFVAAAFALHPVNVDSAAWIAERKNVLSTSFWLLTMWGYAGYVQRGGALRYMVALFAFLLGLLTKPMLVTVPFVLLLLDYWPFERFGFGDGEESEPGRKAKVLLGLVWEKVPYFVLSAASVFMSWLSFRRLGVTISTELVPMKLRVTQGLVSYVMYLYKTVVPRRLAVFYPYPESAPFWESIVAGLLLVAVTFVLVWVLRRRRYFAVGWLWYVGTLVPVIGLVQGGLWPAVADRWMYVPGIGVFVIAAWGFGDLVERLGRRRIVGALAAGACLCALAVCAWVQLGYWQNGAALFRRALEVTEGNYIAHLNLGNELLREKKRDEAIEHYKRALDLHNTYVEAHYNLGVALGLERRYAEAVMAYRRVVELKGNHRRVYFNLALALAKTGKVDEAIGYYEKALEQSPDDVEVLNNFALALVDKGRGEEAIGHYKRALEIEPDSVGVLNNLGNALVDLRRFEEAVGRFERVLVLEPGYATAHYNLANALRQMGRGEDAAAHYREALRFRPGDVEAHYGLGLVLAGLGKYDEAEMHYRRAVELNPDFGQGYYNLGLVFVKRGEIDKAIEQFREVLRIFPDDAEMHCNLGVLLEQQGLVEEAIAEFRTALRLDPNFWRAREQLEAVLKEDPDSKLE
jgi:tetratricopeptide (TPR) repeat protein